MVRADGCARGDAVELLLRAPDALRRPLVLMQRRAPGTPHEDLWGLPGGAQRNGETPVHTVLRETAVVDAGRIRVRGTLHTRSCTTVVADVTEALSVQPELAWVTEPEITALDLDPAFAACWPALRVTPIQLVVDAANVVGSRPDGWWRDRAGAATRLLRSIVTTGPGVLALPPGGFGWVTCPVVVLEGAASRAPDIAGIKVVRAPGSGDDTIVEQAHRAGDCVVVTADRALRTRLPPHAQPLSPSAFLSWLLPHSAGSAG
ncbi:MAG: NUDIX domain-containing protein [Pseudonocardiaceae bacterium]